MENAILFHFLTPLITSFIALKTKNYQIGTIINQEWKGMAKDGREWQWWPLTRTQILPCNGTCRTLQLLGRERSGYETRMVKDGQGWGR